MSDTSPKLRPRGRTATAIAVVALVLGGCTVGAGIESPAAASEYDRTGEASWYGKRYHGRTTASGVPYDMHAMTAAHRSLPFGTRVRVTNLVNRRSVVLTVNDRGPYAGGRIIDVSRRAAEILGMVTAGVVRVRVNSVALKR
jgi:rare lipoprotein A